jgi:hypothetical protein
MWRRLCHDNVIIVICCNNSLLSRVVLNEDPTPQHVAHPPFALAGLPRHYAPALGEPAPPSSSIRCWSN